MLTKSERLISYIDRFSFAQVRAAWIARVRLEHNRIETIEAELVASGMERVNAEPSDPTMPDGREILHIRDRAYALRPEVHAKRLAAAFDAIKNTKPEPETKSVVGTESLTQIVCPKCGDSIQHSSICPASSAGKIGYKHRYSCVCGGADFISKEML